MFALRMLDDVALECLEHCSSSEGWGKGMPTCHMFRWHQQCAPPALPLQLAAGTDNHFKQRGKQLSVLGKELASKPKEGIQEVSSCSAGAGEF